MSNDTTSGLQLPETERKDFLILETQEQRKSLYHPIRREIIRALNQGHESFATEVKKTERRLDDGTLITEEVTIQRPSRRFWMDVQEILRLVEENGPKTDISIYKCYYHLRILLEQGLVEQYPPPKEDDKGASKRVRGMFFRTAAKFFVQSKMVLAFRGSGLAPWDWHRNLPDKGYSELYAEMLGYELDELNELEGGWEELIHPDDSDAVLDRWEDHLSGNTALYSSEHRLRAKSGQYTWVLDRGRVIELDEEGKPLRAAGTIQDITNEKIMMEALDRSEERYRRLFSESVQGIAILIKGRIVLANPAYAETLGRNLGELLEMSADEVWNLIHPDDRLGLEERNKLLSEAKTLPRHRFRYIRPSGEIRWVESHVKAVEHDGTLGLQTLEVDITEQMEIEQALRESEKSFRGIFEASPIGILLLNTEGKIIQINNASKEILGVEDEEDYEDYRMQKDPNLPEWVLKDVKEGVVIGFEGPYDLEKAGFRTTRAGPLYMQVNGSAIHILEDGTVSKYLAHIQDITERVQTREILRESEERYRSLMESRAQPTIILQGSPPRIAYANPAVTQISGYSILELFALGENWPATLLHPNSLQGALAILQDVISGKLEPFNSGYENEYRHKDGHSIWLRNHLSHITYNGEPALEILLIDITDKKEFELALLESEEKYRSYFASTKDALLLLRDAQIIDCNQAALRMFGCKKAEVFEKMLWQLSPRSQPRKKTSKQFAKELIDTVFSGWQQVARWRFKKCDGTTFEAQVNMNLLRLGNEVLIQAQIQLIGK
jgi:PAS domain S-box-containing protein